MKLDLAQILKTLGIPVLLIGVLSALLLVFGVQLELVLTIAYAMVGLEALFNLLVVVLKWAGAVTDGTSGKWSAALNLGGIVGIAVVLILRPDFDFAALDAQFKLFAEFGMLIFGYIVQLIGTKQSYMFVKNGLGVKQVEFGGGIIPDNGPVG